MEYLGIAAFSGIIVYNSDYYGIPISTWMFKSRRQDLFFSMCRERNPDKNKFNVLINHVEIEKRDCGYYTPLMLSVMSQNYHGITELLNKGADPTARYFLTKTVLTIAKETRNQEILSLFRKHSNPRYHNFIRKELDHLPMWYLLNQ